jgi:TonB family protein
MFFTATLIATLLLTTAGPQQPPRDPARPAPAAPGAVVARDSAAPEAELAAKIAASPATLAPYYQLARLQERRGAFSEAEATLLRAVEAVPSDREAPVLLAGFYNQRGRFEQTIAVLQRLAQIDPANPEPYRLIASYSLDKVSKDAALAPTEQLTYIMEGVSAADRALGVDADHAATLIVKNNLLQQRAARETDPVQKQQFLAEAAALRNRANVVNQVRPTGQPASNASSSRPPVRSAGAPGEMAPVRVGGNVKTPSKVRDVKPVYPPDAQLAGITGIIILETTIAVDGRVSDAKVLRSIPLLDQAAVEAVRQWEFTPTYLNGVPVPVIMTVTVNFALQ